MFGEQLLSSRTTGPAYSFGSSPARVTLMVERKRGRGAGLVPSVPMSTRAGLPAPGPIYNPTPTSKWLGDAPHHAFGKAEQRPPMPQVKDASKRTGKSNAPGPGSYESEPSLGHQIETRRPNSSSYTFGQNLEGGTFREKIQTISPGPKYAPPPWNNKTGGRGLTVFSFATDSRDGVYLASRKRVNATPAPGYYMYMSGMGSQPTKFCHSIPETALRFLRPCLYAKVKIIPHM